MCNPHLRAVPSAERIFLCYVETSWKVTGRETHDPMLTAIGSDTSSFHVRCMLGNSGPADPTRSSQPHCTSQSRVTFHLSLPSWLGTDLCWIKVSNLVQKTAEHQTTMWNGIAAEKREIHGKMRLLFQEETASGTGNAMAVTVHPEMWDVQVGI